MMLRVGRPWQASISKRSTRRLAAVLGLAAAGAVLVDTTTKYAHAWMPNIATTAAGIAFAIYVGDSLIRREQQHRQGGRRNAGSVCGRCALQAGPVTFVS